MGVVVVELSFVLCYNIYMNTKRCNFCGVSSDNTRIIFFRGKEFLCNRHRIQITKFGKVRRTYHDGNKFVDKGDWVEIEIISKKKEHLFWTKIDKEDLQRVLQHAWFCYSKKYVATQVESGKLFLHHFLVGRKNGMIVDHKNGDRTDNRKENLRHVTHSANNVNRKKVTGIFFDKVNKKWASYIGKNNKTYWLGRHKTYNEALLARINKEVELYGWTNKKIV